MVKFPPITEIPVVEQEAVPVQVMVPVATPKIPFAPSETRSCDDESGDVVARPPQVRFGVVPPEEMMGQVAVTEVTPALPVEVA
jgi:hypothetical protein